MPSTNEIIAVNIVIPADGPSFGTEPDGTWICMSLSLKSIFFSNNNDFTRFTAIVADSFITSPSCPVLTICPVPANAVVSIKRISPPACVQASPVTTPGILCFSTLSWRAFLLPSSLGRSSFFITTFSTSFSRILTAACLISLSICFFSPLTPASIV